MGFLDNIAKLAPVLSIGSNIASGFANRRAAKEQTSAIREASGITQEQFDQLRTDQEPFRLAGLSALERLLAENIGPLEESPDFLFRRQQGEEAIGRTAAARGKRLSGEAVKAGIEHSSNLASLEAGNRRNILARIAGFGPAAAGETGRAGLFTGGQLAQLAIGAGEARASSFAAPVNAFSSAIEDLIGQAALRGAFTTV